MPDLAGFIIDTFFCLLSVVPASISALFGLMPLSAKVRVGSFSSVLYLWKMPMFLLGKYRWNCFPKSMFRIHDILVWIRICVSMPPGYVSGSCFFRHWPSKRIFIIFPRLNVQKKSNKESMFIWLFCSMIKGWRKELDSYLWQMYPDPGGLKSCGSGTLLETLFIKLFSVCPSFSFGKCRVKTMVQVSARIFGFWIAVSEPQKKIRVNDKKFIAWPNVGGPQIYGFFSNFLDLWRKIFRPSFPQTKPKMRVFSD